MDPSKYTENRKNMLEDRRKNGENPYPHKFHRSLKIPEYREKYEKQTIENGAFLDDVTESVTGRVTSLRASGNKLIFIDLTGDGHKIQVFANAANYTGEF